MFAEKSLNWEIEELENVLKHLKANKSRDPLGIINELFKPNCIGEGLKQAMLNWLNLIKFNMKIPDVMKIANITSIWKKKGARNNLANDRGIFVLTVYCSILDRLLYNEFYPHLEENMSPSNIGAMKKTNIRNHLFVLYGIINSVIQGRTECIDIQIYDVKQCFDALWLDDCLLDMYFSTPDSHHNDKLALIYNSNKENLVSVKSPVGLTERVNIPSVVMQGTTFGPMQCSNSIDSIGKKCVKRHEHLFSYRGLVKVPPLAMVDDLLAVSSCGFQSLAVNVFVNAQIEMKKLQFHTADSSGKSKCKVIHVGKKSFNCPELKVHGTKMGRVEDDVYLGDIISHDGSNKKNVNNRVSKGLGIISQIMNILETISFGEHFFTIAMVLRDSMFINGILTNSEVWYGLKKSEVKALEDLDLCLLRKIFSTKVSCPKEALYLESGIISIGTIIKSRRIKYFHYLINLDETKMLSQFFNTQLEFEMKNDWTSQVKQDFIDLGVSMDKAYLQSKSSESFKKIVKIRAEEYELDRLNSCKGSKTRNLKHRKLEMKFYLRNLSPRVAKLVFSYRTRMAQFSENYRSAGGPSLCPLCQTHLDNQQMAFTCPELKELLNKEGKYEFIFEENIPKKTVENLIIIENQRQSKI